MARLFANLQGISDTKADENNGNLLKDRHEQLHGRVPAENVEGGVG